MQTWFEVKSQYVKIDNNGRERKVTETYLIDAVSFTDAEARIVGELQKIIRGEFQVKDIKQSNVIEIFPHDNGEWWYKAKISIVTIDEKAGRERKVNNYFLVQADDIKEALKRLEEGMSYILVPCHTVGINLTSIADIFPYFGERQTVEKTENAPSEEPEIANSRPESASSQWDGTARSKSTIEESKDEDLPDDSILEYPSVAEQKTTLKDLY